METKYKSLSGIGEDLGKLCEEKNRAYGDSFRRSGDLLKQLYPDGVKPEQYQDMLALVRIIDKMFRIATDKEAFNEDPWADIAGYGILGVFNSSLTSSRDIPTDYRGSEIPDCDLCLHSDVELDMMPCKKCAILPFKPHFRKA